MGSKNYRTINDFYRFDQGVEVVCRCGHRVVLDQRRVAMLFIEKGWGKNLESARKRFRCQRCGSIAMRIGPKPRD
jgi:DNA-directed RNA polymerase subunit RPC12/RpoP